MKANINNIKIEGSPKEILFVLKRLGNRNVATRTNGLVGDIDSNAAACVVNKRKRVVLDYAKLSDVLNSYVDSCFKWSDVCQKVGNIPNGGTAHKILHMLIDKGAVERDAKSNGFRMSKKTKPSTDLLKIWYEEGQNKLISIKQ